MKICITTDGKNLDSQIDARFGRCRYFLIYDTENGIVEAIENSNTQFSGGAGIQSGRLMVSKGVETVLTGNVGPNAFKVLEAAGIKVMTNVSGVVSEAIEKFKQGSLQQSSSPTAHSKFGAQGGV